MYNTLTIVTILKSLLILYSNAGKPCYYYIIIIILVVFINFKVTGIIKIDRSNFSTFFLFFAHIPFILTVIQFLYHAGTLYTSHSLSIHS